MALFKKKEKKSESLDIPKLPEIPQLPELPEFPMIEGKSLVKELPEQSERLPQLPSFPNGSLGNKFSQDTIKEAITGKREAEVRAEVFSEEEGLPMMQRPLLKESVRSYPSLQRTKAREAEPIFIRIDKFEEGSKTFEEVKRKISEIESMFEEVKNVREKEEKELVLWESEIKQVKEKIEKIDGNIFSQIE
jgi:hypothetical protein